MNASPPETYDGMALPRTVAATSDNIKTQPLIHLRVELPVRGHQLIPGQPIAVRGIALATEPIEQITVGSGSVISHADFGLYRPDLAAAYPDHQQVAYSGFACQLEPLEGQGDALLTVAVRTRSGHQETIDVPLTSAGTRLKTGSDDVPSHSDGDAGGDTIRLAFDRAAIDAAGRLQIGGWAVARVPIEGVDVLLDGKFIGTANYGAHRPDVERAWPEYGNALRSGFSLSTDGRGLPNQTQITILVRALGGLQREFVTPVERGIPQPDFVLTIDEPFLIDGVAARPIRNRLRISGWAFAGAGIESIAVELDHVALGNAFHGIKREDIAGLFPGNAMASLSGFGFVIPRRHLTDGRHVVTVTAVAKDAAKRQVEFAVEVRTAAEGSGARSLHRHLPAADRHAAHKLIRHFRRPPEFSIWLKCDRADIAALRNSVRSLSCQVYPHWRLTLIGMPPSLVPHADELMRVLAQSDSLHPARSSYEPPLLAVSAADSDVWVMPLEAGDMLSPDALFEFSLRIDQDPRIELLYADELRVNPESLQAESFFKPTWSPDLLRSTNYIGRPWCAPMRVVSCAQASIQSFLDHGHYDLVLACSEEAERIEHVAGVLCERRPGDIEPAETEIQALRRSVARQGLDAKVEPGRIRGTYRMRETPQASPLVSIIIPTCAARGLVKVCLESLWTHTTYPRFEIICIDNVRDDASEWKDWLRENADVVVEAKDAFNWSRFNNLAAEEASGSLLLFLNDDIEIIQPDWLEPLVALASRPDVGVVGPQLLYPSRKVQHAGLFLSDTTTVLHAFRFYDENEPGYFGLALTQRNVIGVTGACMLVRTKVFHELGGFDEAHAIINNDVDFCLKAHTAGLWNVFTPFSKLIHHETASRGHVKDEFDVAAFTSRWRSVAALGDPFFHPHLAKHTEGVQSAEETLRTIRPGRPRFVAAEVRRILAIKVDHIGDFVMAFPAFRRIKQNFPHSILYVLASSASVQLAFMEPCIDHVIGFDFFHERSHLGPKAIGERDLSELASKLVPLDLDLAIDLRKQSDTRELLRYCGARLTAGFDRQGQFPWMDIALAWEGDDRLAIKRQHISNDMLNLADAVAAAGLAQPQSISRSSAWSVRQLAVTSRLSQGGLYARPVVCLHPAAGTEMRQWPPEHFANLADLLVESDNVNVALIGTDDDRDVADSILEAVRRRDHMTSLVGRLPLAELPLFLETCALFIGNNSGPHHIAAALGVPTVGIHSGVVDAQEWGPLGDNAIALRRDMTCSPCYLLKREECPRNLACLRGIHPIDVLPVCRRLLKMQRADQASEAERPRRVIDGAGSDTATGRHATTLAPLQLSG
jgi:ADP-heptose:LPS heptosyltransferase/GT2 family glycosyltransferase